MIYRWNANKALCYNFKNSEACTLADLFFFFLLLFKAAVSQHSSSTQLGSELLVDVPFRTEEHAVTSVVDDGLVGCISKVIYQSCRSWDRQGWQEDVLEYKGSSSSKIMWLIILCPTLRLYLSLSLKLPESVFAKKTKLKEKSLVSNHLMGCICHEDCTLLMVEGTRVPKTCCSPDAEKER